MATVSIYRDAAFARIHPQTPERSPKVCRVTMKRFWIMCCVLAEQANRGVELQFISQRILEALSMWCLDVYTQSPRCVCMASDFSLWCWHFHLFGTMPGKPGRFLITTISIGALPKREFVFISRPSRTGRGLGIAVARVRCKVFQFSTFNHVTPPRSARAPVEVEALRDGQGLSLI